MRKADLYRNKVVSSDALHPFLVGRVSYDVNNRFCAEYKKRFSGENPSIREFEEWARRLSGKDGKECWGIIKEAD